MALETGLNPYGLAYYFGRQGRGTPRANPAPRGLNDFVDLAEELGSKTIELAEDWVMPLDGAQLAALRARLERARMQPVLSSGLQRVEFGRCAEVAHALGARMIRLALTSVLEGNRAATPGWDDQVAGVWQKLSALAPQAEAAGLTLVIENHQDFTSRELAAFCEKLGSAVRIVLDTGNTFPVAEAPLDFTEVVAPYVAYVHLKDYRVQPTEEGYRLVRCAIGDGAVPLAEMVAVLTKHHPVLPAALEPGALDARHVRLLTPKWWQGYAPQSAAHLAACLRAAKRNALPEDADYRTPWERGEDSAIVTYELDMIRRSAANMRALRLMGGNA
jgi:sugar phosphate isomerase/epimerase